MKELTRVAILDPDTSVAEAAADALARDALLQLTELRDEGDLLGGAMKDEIGVLVLDIAAASDPARTIREVMARWPSACVILTGRGAPATVVGRAIAAGAATYLPKPYQPEELRATIEDLRGAAAPRPSSRVSRAPATRGAIVAVYSPKGGVGATTVATSLAVSLAALRGTRVALVDLDLQFGDVGVLLDLQSNSSLADLLAQRALDAAAIDEIFVRHSTGVHALLAPADPPDMRSVDVGQVLAALNELRSSFNYVICDLWSSLEELTLGVLRGADRVVLVSTPEVPALRHLRRVINVTAPLLSSERTVIVANRAPSKVGVSQADMERALGLPVAVNIPSDGVGVTTAINQGLSVLDPRTHSRVAQSFKQLAQMVAKDLAPAAAPARGAGVAGGVASS